MTIPSDVRTWAEIDLGAIRHNMGVVRQKVGPGPGIMAVVKANLADAVYSLDDIGRHLVEACM